MSDFNGDDLYRNPNDGQPNRPEGEQGQPQTPYGNPEPDSYGNSGQNPYGNPGQNPYGNPGQNPYGNPGQPQNSGQEQNPWQYPSQNPYGQSGFNGYNQGGNQNGYYTVPNYGQGQHPYKKKNNMAVFSMISGIFSIVACCASPLAVILGITGIVLAILSKKGQPMDGFAIAGIILSIVGLVVSLAFFAYYLFILSLMKNPEYASFFNDLLEQYQIVP